MTLQQRKTADKIYSFVRDNFLHNNHEDYGHKDRKAMYFKAICGTVILYRLHLSIPEIAKYMKGKDIEHKKGYTRMNEYISMAMSKDMPADVLKSLREARNEFNV